MTIIRMNFTAHIADRRRLAGSASPGVPDSRLTLARVLGILWSGRRFCRGLRILPGSEFSEGLLRSFGRGILEFLEHGQGFLRIGRTMQAAVQEAQLIPSLLDDLRI